MSLISLHMFTTDSDILLFIDTDIEWLMLIFYIFFDILLLILYRYFITDVY